MSKEEPEECPTCGTLCNVTWSGLDLVENTGDETLASKCYTPDGGLEEMVAELRAENERLKNDLLDALDLKNGNGPTVLTMLANERDALAASHKELVEALEQLMSFQNGPPLPTYEKGWNKGMEMGQEALSRAEALLKGN